MQTTQFRIRVQKDNSTKTTFGNKILGYGMDYFL
jgi:hypothetical protein